VTVAEGWLMTGATWTVLVETATWETTCRSGSSTKFAREGWQFPKQLFSLVEPEAEAVRKGRREVSLKGGYLDPFCRAIGSRCLDHDRPPPSRHHPALAFDQA